MIYFHDSNHYETAFSQPHDRNPSQAPADDRDQVNPDFRVREELAYNLDVKQPRL